MSEQKLSEQCAEVARTWFTSSASTKLDERIAIATGCDTLAAVNSALRGALDYVKNHSTQQDVVFIAEEALSACPPDTLAQQLADSRKECAHYRVALESVSEGLMHMNVLPRSRAAINQLLVEYQGKEGEK